MAPSVHIDIRSNQYKANLQALVDQGGKTLQKLSPAEAGPSKANQGQTIARFGHQKTNSDHVMG